MIPFIKLHTRRFHVTSKIFLRKVVPKSSSSVVKVVLPENNYDPSVNYQNSCPDYLGIESDDNVIIVKPQKHSFQETQKIDRREKFYRASFGIVRFDEDNKPKYHGQFRKPCKVDFTFPHSSSGKAKISNISEVSSYKNQVHKDLSVTSSQKISTAATKQNINTSETISSNENVQNLNYIDGFYFGTAGAENNTQNTASEELNYIDKDYFETLVHLQNTSLNQSNVDSKDEKNSKFCNTNQVEDLNHLEKEYFEPLYNSENRQVEHEATNYTNSNFIEKDQLEGLNYLESDYFKTSSNSDSGCTNKIISTHNECEKASNFIFDAKDDSTSAKSYNFTSDADELNFIDKNFHENCSVYDHKDPTYCDNLVKPSYSEENDTFTNQDMLDNKCSETNSDDMIKNKNKISDSVFTDHNIHKLTKKQNNKVVFKKLISDKTEKRDIMSMSEEKTLSSAKNSKTPKDMQNDNDLAKAFSVQSKLVSEEPDVNDPLATVTAHDFVKQLREEQKIPSQINISEVSRKKLKEEKLDSKGFRILKNQVPNLAYYTRDEILTILKQNIVYSDDDLLVLNKPYSLVIHESKTTKEPCLSTYLDDLAKEMDKQSTDPKLFTVHRLDKETTGCLLLARNETMAMHLKALFAQRKVVKKYWIITSGVPDPPEGVIDMPISEGSINNRKRMVLHAKLPDDILYKNHSKNGKAAVTTYKVIAESGNAALVEAFPKTGVKHQLRVHFGFGLGCPILGDHKYSHLDKLAPQKLPADMLQRLHVRQSKVRHIPMHIHAKSVGIADYFTDGRDLFVNIPIPDYFKLNLKRLKFRKKDMIH